MTTRLTDDQLRELLELEALQIHGPWIDWCLSAAIGPEIRPLVEELLEARKLLHEVAELRLDPDLVRRVEEVLE